MMELAVESSVVPPSEGSMFGEFDHELVDVVILLHLEGLEGSL